MRKLAVTILASTMLSLAGCASVEVHQLDAQTLTVKPHTPNGAVYFLPKPYLLVTRLPSKPEVAQNGGGRGLPQDTGHGENQFQQPPGAGGDGGGGGEGGGSDSGDKSAGPSPAGGSGSDFLAQTDTYVIKLIYLPDHSRPMSINATSGLFGTAKLTPTFQNGWMLTGFSSELDNSKLVDAIGQVVSGITSLRTPTANLGQPPGGPGPQKATRPDDEVLKPGLYEFAYDDKTGRMVGLCPQNFFTKDGVIVVLPSPACDPQEIRAPSR